MISTDLIVVITATTGQETLYDTIDSVQKQIHKNIKHIIVCDGTIHQDKVNKIINNYKVDYANCSFQSQLPLKPIECMIIPWQTGLNNWVCHRIYSAIPNLIVEDAYIGFLDEDNYIDPEHYDSLYKTIVAARDGLEWAYSLRKIVTKTKQFVEYDMCESLGYLSYVWIVISQYNTSAEARKMFQDNTSYYLVDTNCYLIHKNILHKITHCWQIPARVHIEADRLLFDELKKNYKGACSMEYTVNYRLNGRRGDESDSAIAEFYIRGNKYMNQLYNGSIPWQPKTKNLSCNP